MDELKRQDIEKKHQLRKVETIKKKFNSGMIKQKQVEMRLRHNEITQEEYNYILGIQE